MGLRLGITGYTVLPRNKLAPLKLALVASGGPVAVAVDAAQFFYYQHGIVTDGDFGSFTVNHAVTLTGGYLRLEMKAKEEEHCGWDKHPEVGIGCDGGEPKVWVCGTAGILYDAVYPDGVHIRR